nr:hypothetical protein [Tanacetum cinerariifolium]
MIDPLDADEGVALVDKTQGRNDQDMFDTSILDEEEVVSEKKVSTVAKALIDIKTSKPKAKGIVIQEPTSSCSGLSPALLKLPYAAFLLLSAAFSLPFTTSLAYNLHLLRLVCYPIIQLKLCWLLLSFILQAFLLLLIQLASELQDF